MNTKLQVSNQFTPAIRYVYYSFVCGWRQAHGNYCFFSVIKYVTATERTVNVVCERELLWKRVGFGYTLW